MPRPSTIRYTWADYCSTPEDTSRRYEIVDGELFVTAAPRFRHQQVAANLVRVLGNLADAHGLGVVVPGPVTVHLHDELVLEPDVVFIRADRLGAPLRDLAGGGLPGLKRDPSHPAIPPLRPYPGYTSTGGGFGIHWPALDEDLSVAGLLRGARSPEVTL